MPPTYDADDPSNPTSRGARPDTEPPSPEELPPLLVCSACGHRTHDTGSPDGCHRCGGAWRHDDEALHPEVGGKRAADVVEPGDPMLDERAAGAAATLEPTVLERTAAGTPREIIAPERAPTPPTLERWQPPKVGDVVLFKEPRQELELAAMVTGVTDDTKLGVLRLTVFPPSTAPYAVRGVGHASRTGWEGATWRHRD